MTVLVIAPVRRFDAAWDAEKRDKIRKVSETVIAVRTRV
jgi:hypothetical protein